MVRFILVFFVCLTAFAGPSTPLNPTNVVFCKNVFTTIQRNERDLIASPNPLVEISQRFNFSDPTLPREKRVPLFMWRQYGKGVAFSSYHAAEGGERAEGSYGKFGIPWIPNSKVEEVKKELVALAANPEALLLEIKGKEKILEILRELRAFEKRDHHPLSFKPSFQNEPVMIGFGTTALFPLASILDPTLPGRIIDMIQNGSPVAPIFIGGLAAGPMALTMASLNKLSQYRAFNRHGAYLPADYQFLERLKEIERVLLDPNGTKDGMIFYKVGQGEDEVAFVFEQHNGEPHLILRSTQKKSKPDGVSKQVTAPKSEAVSPANSGPRYWFRNLFIPKDFKNLTQAELRGVYVDTYLERFLLRKPKAVPIDRMRKFRVYLDNEDWVITDSNGRPLVLLDDKRGRAWVYQSNEPQGDHWKVIEVNDKRPKIVDLRPLAESSIQNQGIKFSETELEALLADLEIAAKKK